ncbi:hypothetical protein ABP2_0344 [Bacillus subtilis subsp. subtilis]|nr:hypothetical protein [Bacillus subtilis subsp. subtilis]
MNTLIQEAIKLVEAGETEKGLNTLSKAEKQLHDEDKAIAAQLYYEWGDVEKAISLISDLHDLYPNETELTNFYAELLIDIDEEEKALAVLETIPETDPSYPESLLLMADLYQMQGYSKSVNKSFSRQSPFWTMNLLLILHWENFTLLREPMQKRFNILKQRLRSRVRSGALMSIKDWQNR